MNIEKDAQARDWTIYAATNRCCSSTDFKAQFCSEHDRRTIFKTYVYFTLYCLSCFEHVPQCSKTAFRYALLKFFGNLPHIIIRNINNVTTRSSILSVYAVVKCL